MQYLANPTRNLFFTGKGGVGKTSLACAASVQLADRGLRVLLVSTDPASNLDEVIGTPLGNSPTAVSAVPRLFAMNIDPEAAAREYRERMVGPYRGVLPDAAVRSMEEQFSGSCTLEIAAFDEFARLLGDSDATKEFDHVVFDTAPTGHTLRLLTLPSAWSGFVEANTTGTSCLGPLAGLQAQQLVYKQTVAALSDAATTTLILVTRPEPSAFLEAARTSKELNGLRIENQQLVINGVFVCARASDKIAHAMQLRGEQAIATMPPELGRLKRTTVPLSSGAVMGVDALRRLGTESEAKPKLVEGRSKLNTSSIGLGSLIDQLAAPRRGVILAMGKGGVGKTTVASAIAIALAERGFEVHLSTTDPAAHVAATLAMDEVAGLAVDRIDPEKVTADYREEVMRTAGKDLDSAGRALLEEDLRSPCTEEIAVFRAFAAAVSAGSHKFVVLDTAPTGHTILLLDSALAYHREVLRQSSQMPESVKQLLPRLRDPDVTRVLIVTLAEATPVHEAGKLQDDLRRAEIEPFAWVINQSLVPLSVTDPVLRCRQHREESFIAEVEEEFSHRVALIPWQISPPTGLVGLRHLLDTQLSQTHQS